jgi:hypothetical protein
LCVFLIFIKRRVENRTEKITEKQRHRRALAPSLVNKS